MIARARTNVPSSSTNSCGAAAFNNDFAHGRAHVDADAVFAGCLGHGLRDCAHATDRMAPHAFFAIHFTEHVMQ